MYFNNTSYKLCMKRGQSMKNYINKSILKLQKDRDNNRLVIFVGAGVSANSGCPSWSGLIDKFADELGIASEDRKESIEYYLKIPQLYYIERGQKEYFDFIKQNMDSSNIQPNEIDRQIFKLEPHTVITTNFDDLLEKTVRSEGLFYAAVRQDTDLPYAQTEKMIIKMHGDEGLKNIVLKEDDYLSYSKNFPLIENYIKGLFSTKTILFVGYSAEDIDFKIIFKWVKDHLKGHFQPAYMLEIGKEKDRIDFNYYKNRGINILYYDEIENDARILSEKLGNAGKLLEKGEKLLNFLNYINEYNEDKFRKYKKSEILMVIYNKIDMFESWNYVDRDNLIEELKDIVNYIKTESRTLFLKAEEGEKLYQLLDEYKVLQKRYKDLSRKCKEKNTLEEYNKLEKELNAIKDKKLKLLDIELLEKIIQILYKSGITKIGLKNKDIIDFKEDLGILSHQYKDEYEELLDEFNYYLLQNKLKYFLLDHSSMDGRENDYLKKAFYLYNINKFTDAYVLLKDLSKYSLSTYNYKYFFIAQFNMVQLENFIKMMLSFSPDNEKEYYEKILNDTGLINIKNLYNNLNDRKKEVKFIQNINNFSYFYKRFYKFQSYIDKIKEQKNTLSKGGISWNTSLKEIYVEMKDMINYIEKNYIIVYPYQEIRLIYLFFIRAIFINNSISDKKCSGLVVSQKQKVNKFVIKIILKNIKFKDFKSLLDENNIEEIDIGYDEIKYLTNVLQNVLEAAKNNIISKFNFKNVISFNDVISNSLLLLSNTDMQEENYKVIINIFNEFVKIDFLGNDSFNKFLDFIIIGFNKKIYNDISSILEVLETYISYLSNKKTIPRYNELILYNDRFFKQLSIIIEDLDKNAKLTTNRQIKYIIEDISEEVKIQEDLNDSIKNRIYCFLFAIYKIVDEDVKKEIENMINDIKSIIQNKPDKKEYIEFMYNAFMADVIILDEEEQVKFVKEIMNYFDKEDSNEINSDLEKMLDEITNTMSKDKLMRYTVDLIINNKIKYENIANLVQPLKIEFNMFSFFVDKDKFDYTKFEMRWLTYLSENDIEKLLIKNSFARKEIRKLAIEELKNKQVQYMKKDYFKKLLLIIGVSGDEAKKIKKEKL